MLILPQIKLYLLALTIGLLLSSSCRRDVSLQQEEKLPTPSYSDQDFYRIKNELLLYMEERNHHPYVESSRKDTADITLGRSPDL